MKFSVTLASLTMVMLLGVAGAASASTSWSPVGSAMSPSHLGRAARDVATVLPDLIGGHLKISEPAQSSNSQKATTSSCTSCDRQIVASESLTMVLLGTVLLGTSFAVRRLGRSNP